MEEPDLQFCTLCNEMKPKGITIKVSQYGWEFLCSDCLTSDNFGYDEQLCKNVYHKNCLICPQYKCEFRSI